MPPMNIDVKRVYEQPGKNEGIRVLVDRVWPRGIKKEHAGIDLWLRDIAPSTALRKWFAHDAEKWPAFKTRYFKELQHNGAAVAQLLALTRKGKVTLVYGAKNTEFNNAVALREYIRHHQGAR